MGGGERGGYTCFLPVQLLHAGTSPVDERSASLPREDREYCLLSRVPEGSLELESIVLLGDFESHAGHKSIT